MLRICDMCGIVDELPREVVNCTPEECPPVNQAMIKTVFDNEALDNDTKQSIIADLHDNTLMLRHLSDAECVPFVGGQ